MSQRISKKAWLERFKERLNKIEKGELISPNKASKLTGSNWNSAVNFIRLLVEKGIPVGYTASGEPKKLIFPPAGWAYMDEPSDLVEAHYVFCSCGWNNLVIPGYATLCPNCEEKVWFMCRCGEQRDITNNKTFTCHRCGQNYIRCNACFEVILIPSSKCYEAICPSCGETQNCLPVEGTVVDVEGHPIREAWVQLDGRLETTNDYGRFRFTNIPVGTHRIHITHAGHKPYELWITVSSPQRLTAHLQKENLIEFAPSLVGGLLPIIFGAVCIALSELSKGNN